jgi:hypothetical protein
MSDEELKAQMMRPAEKVIEEMLAKKSQSAAFSEGECGDADAQ